MASTIAAYLLPTLLKGFSVRHPMISVNIVEDTTPTLLQRLRDVEKTNPLGLEFEHVDFDFREERASVRTDKGEDTRTPAMPGQGVAFMDVADFDSIMNLFPAEADGKRHSPAESVRCQPDHDRRGHGEGKADRKDDRDCAEPNMEIFEYARHLRARA